MTERESRMTAGTLLMVAGGLIGAGLGLLFAPQSGRRTRSRIARNARRVRNEAESLARDTAHVVTEAVEDLGERTATLMEKGGEMAEDWREHLLDAMDQGQKRLQRERQRLTERWH